MFWWVVGSLAFGLIMFFVLMGLGVNPLRGLKTRWLLLACLLSPFAFVLLVGYLVVLAVRRKLHIAIDKRVTAEYT